MVERFKVNDRVKKINESVYLNIDEIFPDGKYSATIDSPHYIDGLVYILHHDELEFIRSPKDELYLLPEMIIIGYEDADDLTAEFDDKMILYNLIRDTEFPEYNKKLRFNNLDGVVIIYITL